jgi:hypothetical protein
MAIWRNRLLRWRFLVYRPLWSSTWDIMNIYFRQLGSNGGVWFAGSHSVCKHRINILSWKDAFVSLKRAVVDAIVSELMSLGHWTSVFQFRNLCSAYNHFDHNVYDRTLMFPHNNAPVRFCRFFMYSASFLWATLVSFTESEQHTTGYRKWRRQRSGNSAAVVKQRKQTKRTRTEQKVCVGFVKDKWARGGHFRTIKLL